METYVVTLHDRVYVGQTLSIPNYEASSGWRYLRWVRALIDAEKFSSEESARAWAQLHIPHDQYEIRKVSRPNSAPRNFA